MAAQQIWTKAIAAAWTFIALTTFALLLAAVYVGSVGAPIADEWWYVDPNVYLSELFVKNNGHPLVIGRIGLALDYWLFDARSWSLRATSIVFGILLIAAVLWLARLCGHRSAFSLSVLGAVATILLFAAQGSQNFNYGFQFIFVLVFTTTAAAIAALASYAEHPARWKLALASSLCIIAVLSLGNGFLTGFLLAAMAWRLGLPKRVTLGLTTLALACTAAWLVMPGQTVILSPQLAEFPQIAIFALRVLGAAPAQIFAGLQPFGAPDIDPLNVALGLGLVEATAAAALIYRALINQAPAPGQTGAAALILFGGASAGILALSRAFMGQEFALSSRYAIISVTFLIGVALLAWPRRAGLPQLTIAGMGALAAAFAPVSALSEIPRLTEMQISMVRSQTALVVGLEAPGYLGGLLPREEVVTQSAVLRAERKWLFQDPWSTSLGQHLAAPSELPSCAGGFSASPPTAANPAFALVDGVVDAQRARGGHVVVMTDADGVISGYGLVPRTVRDLMPSRTSPGATIAWVGTTRTGAAHTAYLANQSHLLCRMGPEHRPPTA